jgi:hypothetical protein
MNMYERTAQSDKQTMRVDERIVVVTTTIESYPARIAFTDILNEVRVENGWAELDLLDHHYDADLADFSTEQQARIEVALQLVEQLKEYGLEITGIPDEYR